ncbi:helix-turn-helix transcriptional regulator [Desulfomicrobium orale]|uniref:HTH araC/xylS-type domain-containing protein n=1 Tax=Desulfomicrobium orale DSM 12838 TaxID=888061 RepID=A0A0X8JPW4_9BACT|nr:AraC family transcriptional regulator [Desulfomicrobium orale]AMD92708.1 hypothetical protein AXF15_06050 [Desulfomicrobium orale DSM 12838]
MIEDLRATADISESFSLQNHHWSFEQFHISFKKSESAPPAVFEGDGSTCLLIICLDGEVHLNLAQPGTCKDMHIAPGDCALIYSPGNGQRTQRDPACRARFLEVTCPAEKLRALVKDTPLGNALEEAMHNDSPLHLHRPTNPAMIQALNRLRALTSENSGQAKPLALSSILEILWIFAQPEPRPRLSEASLRTAREARSILEANMEQPPHLEALAVRVGVSLSKLKQIFTQAHGMPPYAYLRMIRMERAMHLLRHEGRNVTEAALEVGYSNLSHFSKIFAQHHGLKPSQILRE